MKLLCFFRYTPGFAVSVAVLVGCGGQSQPAGVPSQANAASDARATRSWMSPDAGRSDLLYVSNTEGGGSGVAGVSVYSWRDLKLVGSLTGFKDPQGECVDKAGNVYVTDITLYEVVKYAHGGSTPIETLSDTLGAPVGCAVNPLTGDLAVSNFYDFGASGGILVYPNGSGSPTQYTDPNLSYYYLPGYDKDGNLYVVGLNGSFRSPTLDELANGSSAFTTITLNQSIGEPGDVQWHGKSLAVGDQSINAIYQFKISGTTGTLEGTTNLGAAEDVFQFWIIGGKVIGADNEGNDVGFWTYPAGGSPIKTLKNHVYFPEGVTISKAKK
jgi:hypothetical protein